MIDIVILGVLAVFLLKGLFRGLLKEVCSLLGLVLGGVFAFSFHLPLAQRVQDNFALPAQIVVWGSFLTIFLLVVMIFGILGFVLHRFVKMIFLGGINRLAGALFGGVQAIVLLAVILPLLGSQPAPAMARELVAGSHLAPPFVALGETLLSEGRELISVRSSP